MLTDEKGLALNDNIGLFNHVNGLDVGTTGESPIPFMGLAPGSVGLFQINFLLPQNVRSGNVVVRLVRHMCTLGSIFSCDRPKPQQFHYSQPVLLPVK
ncbi:MAG: hypothetical protein ACR2NN_04700 [Bryobacteraceae bacterium]